MSLSFADGAKGGDIASSENNHLMDDSKPNIRTSGAQTEQASLGLVITSHYKVIKRKISLIPCLLMYPEFKEIT